MEYDVVFADRVTGQKLIVQVFLEGVDRLRTSELREYVK